jgi:predicted P-loop ATPase
VIRLPKFRSFCTSPISNRSNSSELAKNYAEIEYALSGRLRYNELKSEIELDEQPFEEDSARLWLANTLGVTLSQSDAWNSISCIAKNNSYHPVQKYFNQLATEDIDPDQVINRLAVRLFGVVEPIYYVYLKRWLVGVVARVFDPGCKMDTILILQGKEGLGKSMLFARMCKYPEWFCDDMGSIKDKDQLLKMHHALITEWSEADSLLAKK